MIVQKIHTIQKDIVENIGNILGDVPTNPEIYTNKEMFKTYCDPYQSSIEDEEKMNLKTLESQHNKIKEEMENRQRIMLNEIGIDKPSIRVLMIMKATRNTYFQAFSDIIKYIKSDNEERTENRSEKIILPKSLIKMEEQTGTTILTIIQNNL